MSYEFDSADIAYLRGRDGRAALSDAEELALTDGTRIADVATIRARSSEHAAAVVETVLLRRRARAKLDDAGQWLMTDAALQQASATAVARHRAARMTGMTVHDVTCSIGADLVELAAVATCVGSDVDPVRLAMSRHNCAVCGVAPGLALADALHPVSRGCAVFADPARRDGSGRRSFLPSGTVPAVGELLTAYRGRPLAVKCAPGVDFEAVPWAEEIEIVSLNRQAREACLWRGFGVHGRKATVLRGSATVTAETVTETEPDDCGVREPGEWIIDPDPAVVRAGLVRQYAVRHGLAQLDPRIAYLTGDRPPEGERAFAVIEHGRFSEKALRAVLRRHDVGRLEILVRGISVQPDELRARLKPRGGTAATLVLTRIGSTAAAFLCRAYPR